MPSKNQLKRSKKRAQKLAVSSAKYSLTDLADTRQKNGEANALPQVVAKETPVNSSSNGVSPGRIQDSDEKGHDNVMVVDEGNPLFELYKEVMEKFDEIEKEDLSLKELNKPEVLGGDDDDIPDEDEQNAMPEESKKRRKERNKLSVAKLKAMVKNPENVDWTDTSASDPRLLVHIKAYRNVVPVPSHWSLKREYLSSKRGVEKPAFALPKFIQETGIAEMRDAVLEKQDHASLKQKQRERVQPKMGKLDVEYQKLSDAFFRFQTKPELTRYGEVYYEGKEYETNLRHLRPGELSDELKDALNIPPGAPPPWLINQQRFGPPPSYPALKIPGLNAPIPPGASWGFQPGQWGKPPVDEATNRPLYGGDFHNIFQTLQKPQQGKAVEKDLWGELQEPEEESEEEEEEDDEDGEDEDDQDQRSGLQTSSGTETQAGMVSTLPSEIGGTETVSELDLRKRRPGETEEPTHPSLPGQIISERQSHVQGLFGSDRTYDLNGAHSGAQVLGQGEIRKRKKPGDVDVAMDPELLQTHDGIDKADLKNLYEQQKKAEENPSWFQEDLSEMIASESRKRLKRDEEQRGNR